MERMRLAAIVTVAVVAVSLSVGFLLFYSWVGPPATCPLEFGVHALNTTFGWTYAVEASAGIQYPLSEYSVSFFTYAPGSESRVIGYEGPLTSLVSASGNFSFVDRGSASGYLDAGGDYFWASTWHSLWVYRQGQLVGGTVGCV